MALLGDDWVDAADRIREWRDKCWKDLEVCP